MCQMISKQEWVEAWQMFWHTIRWGTFVLCVWFAMLYAIAMVLHLFR